MDSAVEGRFEDAVVIVTGSTRGIGAEIARRFAAEGARVVVSGRTESEGVGVVEEIRSAGGTADETDLEEWEFVNDVNFRAYWLAAKRAIEFMDSGSIINVSSNHAYLTTPGSFPYNAIKAGINGMTRAMAIDFGPHVRVNTLVPGWVAVERTIGEMSEERLAELEAIHPTGRLGRPEDIAGIATFLASEDAAFMTGASVVADGGRTVVMQDDSLPDYRERRFE